MVKQLSTSSMLTKAVRIKIWFVTTVPTLKKSRVTTNNAQVNAAPEDPTHKPENCNFSLCNGIPFKDNKDQVFKYRAGAQLPIKYSIETAHPGHANLSVIDTKTNKPIGTPLKVFDKFGETTNNHDELDWSVKMSDTGKKCSTPGDCVLQFWWHSDQ